jgi:23S rRNA-/tRNA-specific pseudouridylate synthase
MQLALGGLKAVIYRDDEILVADKPHGMPVTPAGEHVEHSLLVACRGAPGWPISRRCTV